MVEWLSSIKEKNLNRCGKFVLTGDMSTLSITKVDLSNMNTLEGKLCCLKATHLRTFQKCSLFIPTHPHLSGNIKDLPKSITNLNLWNCEKLEGEMTK